MIKLKKLAAVMLAAAAAPSFAAIANSAAGNGELFLAVYDSTAKVSYTLDLGLLQNDFFVNGQSDAGYSLTYGLNDANWTSFLSRVNSGNLRYSILANDSSGGTAMGAQRLFTTAQAGNEADVYTWVNQTFSLGISPTQFGTFVAAVNATGTHVPSNDTSVNGSSVNAESDSGKSYFGEIGGTSETINGNAPFLNGNDAGVASKFFYLTRSGTNQLDTVAVDEFGNAGGAGQWLLAEGANGWELTYVLAAVPEPETYALMLAGLAAVGMVARRRRVER